MMEHEFENLYRERLEERIILHLTDIRKVPLKKAMGLYYNSRLSENIYEGKFGVQYLDYTILTDLLLDELEESRVIGLG